MNGILQYSYAASGETVEALDVQQDMTMIHYAPEMIDNINVAFPPNPVDMQTFGILVVNGVSDMTVTSAYPIPSKRASWINNKHAFWMFSWELQMWLRYD